MNSLAIYGRELQSQLQNSTALAGLVDEALIHEVCRATGHRWRRCFWQPAVVILTFLRQVLQTDCSCRRTVAMTVADSAAGDVELGSAGQGLVSDEPSAYSQARQRLGLGVLEGLNSRVDARLQETVGCTHLWCGRRVQVVDGSSVSMPDTPKLQRAFPQPSGQKKGCGFPVARLVALFSWASGGLVQLAVDSLRVGEANLFRRLYDSLCSGDVILGDRLYGSYYDMASLKRRGVDSVFRRHASRSMNFRGGRRLGKGDHIVEWHRPRSKPAAISAKDWSLIPETMEVRHVRVIADTRGFRTRKLELVTTLLDAAAYPVKELARLYRDRWVAELNLRSLKTTLGMDILRCKSVSMIYKEIAMHMIAYNLIRLLMAQAAGLHGRNLHRLSFAGTQQRLLAVLPHLNLCAPSLQQRRLVERLLKLIAADELPHRPNRIEPRAVKRRRKSYPYLVHPRRQARKLSDFYDKR